MAAMQVTPAIFKAYDIRGTTPTTLTEPLAEALGLAFGRRRWPPASAPWP